MKNTKPYLSICIPTYEMSGLGPKYLEQSLNIIVGQSFQDFEVVISDYSENLGIKNVCDKYKLTLNISYHKNTNTQLNESQRMSGNTNNAIKFAKGKIIKILFLDDFLYSRKSIEEIVNSFDLVNDDWLVTAAEHSNDGTTYIRPFYPRYNKKIHLGKNTISSPSVLTIKNSNPLLFDLNLTWLMDCDYYKRCYDKFGPPKILNKINVVNRIGKHQVSNALDGNRKKIELNYVKGKHENNGKKIKLSQVTLVSITSFDTKSAIQALKKSMVGIDFYNVVLISHIKPKNLDIRITFKKCKTTQLRIKDPKNTNDYSKFIAYDLADYIESDFALVVHKNAHVLRPQKWSDEFLKYDYIGAPWSANLHFTKAGKNVRVGNGGFSLRSKKLLKSPSALNLKFTDDNTGYFHEDGLICVYHREKLEKAGIKYAPVPLAARFSGETLCKDSDLEPFGYHDNPIFKPGYLNLQKIFYWMKKLI